MKLYIKCNKLENPNDMYLHDNNDKLYYIIRKKQMKFFKALEVFDEEYNELFQVNINPLKFNNSVSTTMTLNIY